MKATEAEFNTLLDYLSKSYPAEEVPKLNVNNAAAIDFESRLALPRSQAALIVQHRTKHGSFKTIKDLTSIPGVDKAKIEARKDRIAF